MNNNVNLTTYANKASAPSVLRPNMTKSSSGFSVLGKYSNKNTRENMANNNRHCGDLLKPFDNNPYTHSLTNAV